MVERWFMFYPGLIIGFLGITILLFDVLMPMGIYLPVLSDIGGFLSTSLMNVIGYPYVGSLIFLGLAAGMLKVGWD